ncbi:MAG: hypothetical protein ABEK03_00710 [Candidatus Bipolaricaulia bacterium]
MKRLRFSLTVLAIALAVGVIGPPLPAQTEGPSFADDLRGSTLDRQQWDVERFKSRGDIVATEDGLRMEFTVRNVADFFAHNVWLNCRISGDFDARLSYELTKWPRDSGIRLGLGVHPNPKPFGSTTLHGVFGDPSGKRTAIAERISLKRGAASTYPSGGQFYLSEMNGREGRLFVTTDMEGQVRISRENTTYKAWYYDDGGDLWIPTGQWSVHPDLREDEWATIQLWGRESSPNVEVLVRDFSLNADELECP